MTIVPIPFAADDRTRQLEAMAAHELDVLVVGGGVTGVGVALDAATRGWSVGIIERDDWACGTSSRSSKMIHGGLRYLASGDISVVRESLRERRRIQNNAAHLTRPLPMLLPIYGRGPVPLQRTKLGIGMWLYELLGHRAAAGSFHSWLKLPQLTRLVPGVALDSKEGGGRLRGAYHYHDGSADDVRLVLSILRAAIRHGANAVNGAPALRMLREGDRVVGAVVGGDAAAAAAGAVDGELTIKARVVVNATGVWADRTVAEGEEARGVGFHVQPSKGIHLTVPRDRVGVDSGIAFFGQTDNSNVFIEPWQDDLAIIGTTDVPYDGDLEHPTATDEDITWLLDHINAFLREPVRPEHVLSSWAGLRPLVVPDSAANEEQTKDVSRRHLLVDRPGVVTITGGKLTAYRAMAEMTGDAVGRQLGLQSRSRTRKLPLDGCRAQASSGEIGQIAAQLNISRGDVRHLLRRHGSNVPALVAMIGERPELGERLHP
ncbi:MAG: glycerol-3-phosphate dehydrogenase/oxidase, partial [Gaiellales bacterium]